MHKETTVCVGYAGGYAQMILQLQLDRWTVTKQTVDPEGNTLTQYQNDEIQPTESFPTLEWAMLYAAQEIDKG